MHMFHKATCFSGLTLALLAGCGGGGGDGIASPTLGGVAAVGAPIVGGAVTVVCAGGSTLNATTLATGSWQVTTSGQTLPCAVQVTGGTVGGAANSTPYHSIAMTFGTANITPLTDLIVANLTGTAPVTWFGGASPGTLQLVTSAQLTSALQAVTNALGMTATLAGADPFTATFIAANGNLLDDVLEALAAAGSNHQALLALAVNSGFSAPNGFNFSGAYASVVVNNGGQAGAGSGTLRVAFAVAGAPATTIDVQGVAAPASQSEFCSELASDSTFSSIGTQGGGSFTVNSCSFSGNVGTINATLTTQGFMLPYAITYTYL